MEREIVVKGLNIDKIPTSNIGRKGATKAVKAILDRTEASGESHVFAKHVNISDEELQAQADAFDPRKDLPVKSRFFSEGLCCRAIVLTLFTEKAAKEIRTWLSKDRSKFACSEDYKTLILVTKTNSFLGYGRKKDSDNTFLLHDVRVILHRDGEKCFIKTAYPWPSAQDLADIRADHVYRSQDEIQAIADHMSSMNFMG